MNYKKNLIILIAVFTVLRILFASALELGADEAYYWTYAQKLQWNYFDHPPLVAWLIRLSTFNLLFHNEFFVRFGANVCVAICTWLFFQIGSMVKSPQVGWFAALLYTSSAYISINTGSFILPDSPQMVFWLTSIFLLIKISRLSSVDAKYNLLWCLFGLAAGLCIMSKVHGVFLWLGVVLYALFADRGWLKNKGMYIAAVITLTVVSPIIIWNVQHNFITYYFHSSRIKPAGFSLHLTTFLKVVLGEINLTNPFNFFLICRSLFLLFKRRIEVEKKEIKLLLFCSLPLIILILIISVFRGTSPHWPGPAYSILLILPAISLAADPKTKLSIVPRIVKWAFAYLIFVMLVNILSITYFPGTVSIVKTGPKTGTEDITLDMYKWKEIAVRFDSLYKSDISNKIMPRGAPIVVTNWSPAATIEYYIAYQTKQEVLGIGDVFDLHQYYWANQYKKPLKEGDNAYFIVPSDSFYYRTFNEVNSVFNSNDLPLVITQYRSGIVCRYISVYRMRGYKVHPKK